MRSAGLVGGNQGVFGLGQPKLKEFPPPPVWCPGCNRALATEPAYLKRRGANVIKTPGIDRVTVGKTTINKGKEISNV